MVRVSAGLCLGAHGPVTNTASRWSLIEVEEHRVRSRVGSMAVLVVADVGRACAVFVIHQQALAFAREPSGIESFHHTS